MASLTSDEEKTTIDFLKIVNEIRFRHKVKPMSFNSALKFMMARKFDLYRALSLYEAHELTRFREGLAKFDPTQDPVKTELAIGKFTVLPTRDSSGAAIAIFTACKHIPSEVSHQTTLQGVVYQMDIALEDRLTQRSGIVFIYNMSNSKYANFDYELSQKILGLLKGAYPAKLKKVLIVNAPLWFKTAFKILRLLVREKLRDRVFMVNLSQLPQYIPLESLPEEFGGKFKVNHLKWLKQCYETDCSVVADLYDLASFNKYTSNSSHLTSITGTSSRSKDNLENGAIIDLRDKKSKRTDNGNCSDEISEGDDNDDEDDVSEGSEKHKKHNQTKQNNQVQNMNTNRRKPTNIKITDNEVNSTNGEKHILVNKQSSSLITSSSLINNEKSEFNHCFNGDNVKNMSLEEFIQYMKTKGRKGLCEEYNEIKMRPPSGTFERSRLRYNQCKNRYTDVLCYDHSIVKLNNNNNLLNQEISSNENDFDDDISYSEYINANYVDGYMQKNAFISTQGPLPKTYTDFWRMVWQENVLVIVMTTRTLERGRVKCGQYWPLQEEPMECGPFKITNCAVTQVKDYIITNLIVYNEETKKSREITHMQFISWPDYGVPQSAIAMLDFREKVRDEQKRLLSTIEPKWEGHESGPPIIVHCSAGIGRTGTFITLDISILQLEATGSINIKNTVEKIRSQRAYSIQMPDQYVFCYFALLEYAFSRGFLQNADLSGFDESDNELDDLQ